MVQTNIEEIQKLGEKLQELVSEARPMLKDLNLTIKAFESIERRTKQALDGIMERLTEATELYDNVHKLADVCNAKLENTLEAAITVDEELKTLQTIHKKIQRAIVATLSDTPIVNKSQIIQENIGSLRETHP